MPHTRKPATRKQTQSKTSANAEVWIGLKKKEDDSFELLFASAQSLSEVKSDIITDAMYDKENRREDDIPAEYFLLDVRTFRKVKYTPAKVEVV